MNYHKDIPRDLSQNLSYRQEVLKRARASNSARRALKKACAEDLLFWINTFVWQFNPRIKRGGEAGPFVTWPFQEEALLKMDWCVENDKDVILIKSREMGATWLALMLFDWRASFRPWQKFLVMSRNEKAVEDEDPDSLFWKIDHLHRYLPDWLSPAMKRRKLAFVYEETHGTITGTASTEKAGVGGRGTAMFIDELSQIDDAAEVIDRTTDTTGCRIFCGTHKGVGTAFHKLTEDPHIEKVMMHWSQHPHKNRGLYRWDAKRNAVEVIDKSYPFADYEFERKGKPSGGPYPGLRSPWYDEQCRRKKTQRGISEDLDIDPAGSVSQFFDALSIHQLRTTHTREPYWQGDITYDIDTGKPIGLTRLDKGPLRLWFHPDKDGKFPAVKAAVGIDVSTGQGKTNSVFSACNVSRGEKLLEYARPDVPPYLFAPLAIALCLMLRSEEGRPAYMVWEHDGPGVEFGYKVIEKGYGNIYMRQNRVAGPYTKQTSMPGWYPSVNEKRILLEEYRAALETFKYVNFSDFALSQCLPYRYNINGSVEHPSAVITDDPTGAKVNHGDHVIADALSWMGAKEMGVMRKGVEEEEKVQVGSLAWRRQIADKGSNERTEWHD